MMIEPSTAPMTLGRTCCFLPGKGTAMIRNTSFWFVLLVSMIGGGTGAMADAVFDTESSISFPLPAAHSHGRSSEGSSSPHIMPSISGGTSQTYVLFVSTNATKDVTAVSGGGLTWTMREEQCCSKEKCRIEMWTAQGSPSAFQVSITVCSIVR